MLAKTLAASLLRLLYRVEVRGLENVEAAGARAVIVANHVSFLDAPLLAAFLPGRPTFAIDTRIAAKWWVRPFLRLVEAYPMDPVSAMPARHLVRVVEKGKRVVVFPEGRITVTGALMKIYDGPGMVADKAGAPLVPVRIDGPQYSPLSRMSGTLRMRLFPKVTLTVLPPRRLSVPEDLVGRRRRQVIGLQLYDLMSRMMYVTAESRRTLFAELLAVRRTHGGGTPAVEDIDRKPLTYDRLVLGSLVLGRCLVRLADRGENVGVLLPNAAGALVTFFGLQAFGRVPAMLNYSTGLANMRAACETAGVRTVLTSRRFLEAARMEEAAEALGEVARVVYLEDLRAQIGLGDKLRGLAERFYAARFHGRLGIRPDDPAAVLFTSGSEGRPKGVVLSHRNILANCRQVAARVDFSPADIAFNTLPMFHSFGLTGATLLPLFYGVRLFLYPSPLHYRIIPELVYGTSATILFGTDTFLAGYAKRANAYDFRSLRYVFAGAEKVKEETRVAWMERFGLRLLEGYGATETAPVLAVNTPMHFRSGSVGRLLPGMEWRLEPIEGIERGGRLIVRGANVMLGYLKADRPGELQPPAEGWYDTGDVVEVDDQGFAHVVGRAKRFAKIGGEMIALGAVEALAGELWPRHRHAAIALPGGRKGEELVLVTEDPEADRDRLRAHARERRLPELMVPKTLLRVDKVPVLVTGKVDYPAVTEMVAERLPGAARATG